MPRIECFDSLGRPHATGRRDTADVVHIAGKQCRIEIGPEPGNEEHHLGCDKQDHSVAVRNLHHTRVKAFNLSFADDVAPPDNEGVENAEHAQAEDQRSGGIHMMHPADGADRHE